MDLLTLVITSLTERLVGEGIGQDLEYEKDLLHNVLAST